nr:Hsp20/alpha crystallin family protein [Halalkaliarchaeum desulfuricum]
MRYTPFEDIDRLFERMSESPAARRWGPLGETWSRTDDNRMDVDVAEYDDEIVVMADLPGFEREEIDVTIDEGSLRIHAERERESEHGSGNEGHRSGDDTEPMGRDSGSRQTYLHRERRHESVSRRISLPRSVREDVASAHYRNGVLTVTLPLSVDRDDGHRIDVE